MIVHIVYGSDSGTTRRVADGLAARFPGARVRDVKDATKADFESCDLLILGTPTCGLGDVQDDWVQGLEQIADADLAGHRVALFGTGDAVTYADSFCDGVGTLYDAITARGAVVVGFTSTEGYSFEDSKAVREERFVGLMLDEDNQRDKSKARVDAWVAQLK